MFITRDLEEVVRQKLQPQKVIVLYGARRVGKTILTQTIADHFEGKTTIYNGEEPATTAMLSAMSAANYQSLFKETQLLVIDEAQSIPSIGKILKLIVDSCPWLCVLATGSSSFNLLQHTGEPLVGRAYYMQLHPLSTHELTSRLSRLDHWQHIEEFMLYGSYPELQQIPDNARKQEYLKAVAQSYLYKDILNIDGVRNSVKIRNLLQLLAYQIGQEVSYEELSGKLGISRNTVERYIDLLCTAFTLFRLPAYSRNPRREVVRPGKIYFYDNGIRNAVIDDFRHFTLRQDIGALWENYMISERIKKNNNNNVDAHYYFWRTYDGQEIDLIEETGDGLHAFEFKWGERSPKEPPAFARFYPSATYEVINRLNYLSFVLD